MGALRDMFIVPIREHPVLAAFTVLYLVGSIAGLIATGNREFLFYFLQMLLLIGLVLWAHRRAGFSTGVLWCLSVWGLAHMAGGLVPVPREWILPASERAQPVLYSVWLIRPEVLKYDNVVHAFGFFSATLACHQALRCFLDGVQRRSLAYYVVLAAAGMGLGAANEVVEFGATLALPDTNVGGYRNTALDLVFNGIGAVIGSAAVAWHERRGRPVGCATPPRRRTRTRP